MMHDNPDRTRNRSNTVSSGNVYALARVDPNTLANLAPNGTAKVEIASPGGTLQDHAGVIVQDFGDILARIVALETQVARIPALEAHIVALETQVARIPALEAQVARIPALEAHIVALETQVARIPDLEAQVARIPALEAKVASLQAENTEAHRTVSRLKRDVRTLEGRVMFGRP